MSIVFNIVNVYLVDGNHSYHLLDMLISKDNNLLITADILYELSRSFKKNEYINGTIGRFYENLPYKLFNYIMIKEFDTELKKIETERPHLALSYKDQKISLLYENDLTFGFSLGLFLGKVKSDL